jgi:transcriptional regulator with XRE-family HTH domain
MEMSRKDLAAEAGLSISAIARFERNEATPTDDQLSALVVALGLTPAWFESFGSRLRTARLAVKLTARELGEVIGRSERTVFRYEWGKSEPSLVEMRALAARCRVSVGWLLNDEAPAPAFEALPEQLPELAQASA